MSTRPKHRFTAGVFYTHHHNYTRHQYAIGIPVSKYNGLGLYVMVDDRGKNVLRQLSAKRNSASVRALVTSKGWQINYQNVAPARSGR